jgi:hypothetical protein
VKKLERNRFEYYCLVTDSYLILICPQNTIEKQKTKYQCMAVSMSKYHIRMGMNESERLLDIFDFSTWTIELGRM